MSDPIYFAPLRVPLVDPQTGIISREWYLLFQAIFNRIGGTSGQSTDDLLQGMPNELGAAELLALQASDAQAAAQSPPMILGNSFDDLLGEMRQTRDALAELGKQLQGIQQGTVSL